MGQAKGYAVESSIINRYSKVFTLLSKYDSSSLDTDGCSTDIISDIGYEEAKDGIEKLKEQLAATDDATNLFGIERDDSFKAILQSLSQEFDGEPLYPTIEERASLLLYSIIKGHPFSDGNKRIGAIMFAWFLSKNNHLFNKNGSLKISNDGLVVLAILVAQSSPSDEEQIINLICNMIKND